MKYKEILVLVILSITIGFYNLFFGENSLFNLVIGGWIVSMVVQLSIGFPLVIFLKKDNQTPNWFKPYKKINPVILLLILLTISIIVANATLPLFGITIGLISLIVIHISLAKLIHLDSNSKLEKKLMFNLYILFFIVGIIISVCPAMHRIFTGR
ncbi:MAG: hypothetical protein GW762_00975 [Candidatus Pacebacteria bacterium]|nr:hypothetical protein [Candidatus Paceibacterota bacterium]PIR63170.1 MAG: hypothetical protein COU64_05640 [Candidatus Pacebacteria bacterium CG10_big_fil_rev_8_21_14_0_10_40_26]PIZ78200.1 MAG: hypothetical protein COY01_05460 [Candidatus Pacebacteria bacterium CG_4_10_14_0_2_um_filter_40_20]PJA68755.1 MAG: hypothetical protein CO156_04585 [Candidatus Pacebacteria bacterium CG_4_9_14_3_um_filter_40_12]PJC41695.1 MAG: hypothetical protein CO041_03175 [Candidatus Pacebacteria bacterium CG_4_9_